MNSEGQRLKQGGFTLIEVMIAVVLLAIIFAITFNVLHFAVKAWDKGVVRAEVTNRVTLVQELLRSAMMQAQPVALKTDDHSKQLAFVGGEGELRFVAPLSTAQKSGGLYVLNIQHVQYETTGTLVLRYHRYHYNDESFSATGTTDVELLLDNVEGITFRYFGPDEENGVSAWKPAWVEQSVLPYKIEMTVRMAREDVVWPILVADPKMAEKQLLSQLQLTMYAG